MFVQYLRTVEYSVIYNSIKLINIFFTHSHIITKYLFYLFGICIVLFIFIKCPSCFYKNPDKFCLDLPLSTKLEQEKGNYYNE